MTYDIRKAREFDLPSLARLNGFVHTVHVAWAPETFEADPAPDALIDFLTGRLSDPNSHFAIARVDGDDIGYIWFERQERPGTVFTKPFLRLYVHHIAVDPSRRSLGVGTALMAYLETEAVSAGISTLALGAWSVNEDAIGFFKARGYAPMIETLRKTI